ncbi:MAG: substrate-binding domain-containing protein [Clostridia bacterium]|nr:substrate-binding domain-containing protein [Clostridia bacterium]
MINKRDRKTTIGVLVDDIFSDFAKDVIHSTINGIPDNRDIDVVVFAGKYVSEKPPLVFDYEYKKLYNTIYKLAEICEVDGLIISLGSIDPHEENLFLNKYNTTFENIPKVIVAAELDNYITVNYDNEMGIREAIDCLINVHGITEICMLGGRHDNGDALKRKDIYRRCLEDHGITYSEDRFIETDMSINTYAQASTLLDRNPDCQAFFCVNDAVARGLYEAMAERDLIPGKDVMVFGFDNTLMAGELMPSLSSVGAAGDILGQKAVDILLDMLDGKEVESVLLPTCLFGRESFGYEMYEYSSLEMNNVDTAFIYRMFDDCFYRYKNEKINKKDVNLQRLFFEIASKMLFAMKRKYMSLEEFNELKMLIDIFFENGIMEYTDTAKLIKSIDRLQAGMNVMVKSPSANVMNNRLFSYMKDRALRYVSRKLHNEQAHYNSSRDAIVQFLVSSIDFTGSEDDPMPRILQSFNKLGFQNGAFYMYRRPVHITSEGPKEEDFDTTIDLRCAMKNGELYVLPPERRSTPVSEMFIRDELSSEIDGYIVFPVFHGPVIYGALVCEATYDIYDRGEYIAGQLGTAIYSSYLQQEINKEHAGNS